MRILPIIEIDLSVAGEQVISVAQCNRLWLPPKVLRPSSGAVPYAVVTQVTDAIVGIRFGTDEEPLPFGVGESMANSFSGCFSKLWVRVIVPSATAGAKLYLQAGSDVVIGYGNESGLSPSVNNASISGVHIIAQGGPGGTAPPILHPFG